MPGIASLTPCSWFPGSFKSNSQEGGRRYILNLKKTVSSHSHIAWGKTSTNMHHIKNCSIFHGFSWFWYMCFMHWRLVQMHSCYQDRWIHRGNPPNPIWWLLLHPIHPNSISTRSLGARPPCHLAVYPMGNDDIAWDFWAYFQTEPNSSLVHTFFSLFLNFRIVVVWDSVCVGFHLSANYLSVSLSTHGCRIVGGWIVLVWGGLTQEIQKACHAAWPLDVTSILLLRWLILGHLLMCQYSWTSLTICSRLQPNLPQNDGHVQTSEEKSCTSNSSKRSEFPDCNSFFYSFLLS